MTGAPVSKTGGDLVVATLRAAGVDTVFGIISIHNTPIYDALLRDGRIRPIMVRHEQAAVGMADGYSRASGKLGVTITSTGPGAANAMGALVKPSAQAEARHSGAARHYQGTGLGLALTRKLVEFQRGAISVESEPGRGSVFTVILPHMLSEPV